jgi:hypothetical protein
MVVNEGTPEDFCSAGGVTAYYVKEVLEGIR